MDPQDRLCLYYPSIFAGHPRLAAAESTRKGGVSKPPYDSLNLGIHTADRPGAIAENRRRFFAACGFSPDQTAGSHQRHGSEILLVEQPGYVEGYDALISNQPGILLTVTIADCTPILLFDPVTEAFAAIHAGWKGTAAGIAGKTLKALEKHFATKPSDCLAYIGTCIDHCDFEVDADVADHFTISHKKWEAGKNKFFVDLKAANKDELQRAGIPDQNIQVSPHSTYTRHQDYFSHRFEKGTTGRMLAAIGLRP